MDGHVLLDAVAPEYQQKHPVRSGSVGSVQELHKKEVFSAEEQARIEQGLKGLGYLG